MFIKTIKIVILYFLWSNVGWSQSSPLDESFAEQGAAKYFDVTHTASIRALLKADDGSIITIGERRNGFGSQLQMLGYTEDGELNSQFGGDNLFGIPAWGYPGIVNTDFPEIDWESAICAAKQNDGKIIIGGNAGLQTPGSLIARYHSNGSIDESFNGTGYIYSEQGNLTKTEALYVLPDGNIVAAGLVDEVIGVTLISPDGTISPNFGSDGLVKRGIARISNSDMAVDSKGRIVIVGAQQVGASFSIFVSRIVQDGNRDVSFGTAGEMSIPFGSQGILGVHLIIDDNDEIIVAGEEKIPFTDPGKLFLAKVTEDGNLDSSFGTMGFITHERGESITPHDVLVEPDGKIIVTGRFVNAGVADLFVAKFNADGMFNQDFGNQGLALTGLALDQSNNTANGAAIAIQSSGKILAAGTIRETAQNKTLLVRFDNEVDGGVTTSTDNFPVVINNLEVFPNPFSDGLSFQWDGAPNVTYQILDGMGRCIKVGAVLGNSTSIDLGGLESSAPLFFIRLQSDDGQVLGQTIIRSK